MVNKVEFLSKVSLFSLMKTADLQRIASLAAAHMYHPGDMIIREGEGDRRLFIIVSGQVEVIKAWGTEKERRVHTLGPMSYFGEMALIDNLVRSASVVAIQETRALSLDRWDLRQEIENCPALAAELLQMLSMRIRAIEKRMYNTLGSFLPICSSCKRIRDENGLWTPMEAYIEDHSESEFSHGICPECSKKLYPEFFTGQ